MPPEMEAALQARADVDRIEIWPDMVPAFSLFLSMETQWRWVGAGMAGAFRTGLDYSVLPTMAQISGVAVTAQVLADLRVMENAAVEEWSRK